MTVSTLLNIALWFFTIIGYIVFNLYQKNIKLERIVEDQNQLITNMQAIVEQSDKMLSEMDKRGIFKSDDEVGTFFNTVMEIQKLLNQFFRK
jgi:type II secretory pathway component PulJ